MVTTMLRANSAAVAVNPIDTYIRNGANYFELPMPFIFIALPLAGATWLIFLGEIFLDNIRILAGKATP